MHLRVAPLLAGLLAFWVAGCSGSSPAGGESSTVTTITDPSMGRNDPSMGDHLHDYWGGQHTLTVADESLSIQGITWFSSSSISVASIRPPSGNVVPQGAGWVNVTVSWQDDSQALPANRYESPQLYVKTAADNELVLRADLTENPSTVALPIEDSMADLPHQVLSAWQFDLFLRGTPNPGTDRYLAFSGTVSFVVTTDHTRNITLYPGHPDRWNGATEIALFDASGSVTYTGDPTTPSWACFGGCPVTHVPDDGVVVPYNADHVVVKLTQTNGPPFRLGLKVHGADTFEFSAPRASPDSATERVYTIAVGTAGDGPYARQSQWEFTPYPEGPDPNGFIMVSYTIEATAFRNP